MDENGSSIGWPEAWDYGKEKLSMATFYLATGSDTIEERLALASDALRRIHSPEKHLPPELQERFRSLLDELAGDKKGLIEERIRAMTDSDRESIAETILELDRDMRELHFRYVETPRRK